MRINLTRALEGPISKNWRYFAFVFLLSTACLPLVYNGGYDDPKKVIIAILWSYAIWITQFTGHYKIIETLDRKVPWVRKPLLRMVLGVLFMVLYASFAYVVVNVLMNLVFFQKLPSGSISDWIEHSQYAIKISFWVSLTVTLIGFFRAWKTAEVEKEKLNTQIVSHKYNALREQINPHFLFNSLNVLSDLVYEDQEMAVKFIRQMSDLYRYVLSVKNEDLVALKDEIDFAHSFAFLLKTRFENSLNIEFELDSNSEEQVVPMSLQLLIENAVKHNEASSDLPLTISLKREAESVIVTNNIQYKNAHETSTKKGLDNLINRYKFLSDEDVIITKTDSFFEVRIPILKVSK